MTNFLTFLSPIFLSPKFRKLEKKLAEKNWWQKRWQKLVTKNWWQKLVTKIGDKKLVTKNWFFFAVKICRSVDKATIQSVRTMAERSAQIIFPNWYSTWIWTSSTLVNLFFFLVWKMVWKNWCKKNFFWLQHHPLNSQDPGVFNRLYSVFLEWFILISDI